MSPARARTTNDAVFAAGRELLEAGGLDALTMQAVAARVGIRAPSLYKRVANRSALIAAIAEHAIDEQGREIAAVVRGDDPVEDLRRMARAYRAFAHRAPQAYQLTFRSLAPDARPPVEASARAAAPLLAVTGRLVGPERALEAARLVTAFVHGFVSMELAGAFRLGGDVDAAYRFGVDAIVRGLADGARDEVSRG
ncbi:MAG TPA: WHG domain-containing protein [Candidatus Limnocylindrales bacterium]|nr:WHG domain-containing protein [Candidatus Limnocylindrales bacterium]